MIKKLANGKWQADFWLGQKRKQITRENRKILDQEVTKHRNEYFQGQATPGRKNSRITFQDFCYEEYIPNHVKIHHKNPKGDERRVKYLCDEFGHLLLVDITQRDIEKWQGKMKDEKQQVPATVNRRLTTLKCILNKAVQWDYLVKSPARFVKKLPRENKRDRYLTKEEIARIHLVAKRGTRFRAFFDIAINTGIRLENLKEMRIEDLKFNGRVPTIYLPENKSDRPYSVPMNSVVFKILSERAKVVGPDESILDTTNLRKEWERAKKLANIKNCTIHDLRHTFASHLAQKGVNLSDIGKLLNHSDPKLTWRYAHLSPDYQVQSVNMLDFDVRDYSEGNEQRQYRDMAAKVIDIQSPSSPS
jgi:integrase